MKSVAVIGSNGQLGSDVVEVLEEKGILVILVSKPPLPVAAGLSKYIKTSGLVFEENRYPIFCRGRKYYAARETVKHSRSSL